MDFNSHYELQGRHALLAPSNYSWLNYDLDKFDATYRTREAAAKGTKLHEFAAMAISLGLKQPRSNKTLNLYVNDAIGFKMTPEVSLKGSDICFGTADALSFRDGILRVHDLKTGITKASFDQLVIYAGLFCIEYGFRPMDIQMELRLYQNDTVEIYIPSIDDIFKVMDRIKVFTRRAFELENTEGE
jgi:hypothetical protein